MKVIESVEEFENLIKEGTSLCLFGADWCGPCKMITPSLEELDGNVMKVDVDKHLTIAARYSITCVPTVLMFKDGEEDERMSGVRPKSVYESKLRV